ncbi:F-box only protein 4 isoform X1 [Rhinatrema bivittatum]|uniref:F-box only protein 4 isoform X1 n=1 Tax=Rhinatrema bivittatum TaxID=194408 RepID=UPI001127D796|nr:F-box only protein 4 isoform X1 [Rhinatrema bivittatum]
MAETPGLQGEWGRLESVLNTFRHFRDRYLLSARKAAAASPRGVAGECSESPLQTLPVDMQLYIMSFLSPRDVCQLGSTNHYWHEMVQDPVLWRYFLLRDLPSWTSVDWNSLPGVELLKTSFSKLADGIPNDYMAGYLKSCPQSRSLKSSFPRYGTMTSFFQSLITHAEPRFAMFGPGLEEMDDSLVRRMMTSPGLLPVTGISQRQIDGIGSGVSFLFNNQHKFNILTLYSTTRRQWSVMILISRTKSGSDSGRKIWSRLALGLQDPGPFSKERERARAGQSNIVNRMFLHEAVIGENQESLQYSVIPQVQEACRAVDGFIYVANAEAHKNHNRQDEYAHILAMTDPSLGPPNRPVLVLSCVTRAGVKRVPCVYMAHELCINLLTRPWMVQDTEVETLTGLLDGMEWMLGQVGIKI